MTDRDRSPAGAAPPTAHQDSAPRGAGPPM